MEKPTRVLLLAAVGETATGILLLLAPTLVVRVLFGTAVAEVGVLVARVAGIALIGLGVGCVVGTARVGMLTYSGLATLYLAIVAVRGDWCGPLLWPAVVLHAVLTVLLARESR